MDFCWDPWQVSALPSPRVAIAPPSAGPSVGTVLPALGAGQGAVVMK